MNPNNDDNTKVGDNYYFDDTHNSPSKYTDDCGNNNIFSFYLWWKQVQVRVFNDDHNDVIVYHASIDNVMCGNDPHNNIPSYIYGIDIDCKRDRELNNDATNLLSCVLLSLELISIIGDLNPDCDNDQCMVQCNNTSYPNSSLSFSTNFTISSAPSSLETTSLSSDHNLVHSAHRSVTNSRSSSLLNST